MKVFALIPARYLASRFPGKLMQLLGDKPVILHTYENAVATGLFDEVWVITDSELIYQTIKAVGGNVLMSVQQHESGSDRIAEAVEQMDVDVVVNVQGDEPFVQKAPLEKLVRVFADKEVRVASLMRPISSQEDWEKSNHVKVVTKNNGDALYFSRAPIPYHAAEHNSLHAFLHVGVYAYRRATLLQFTTWPQAVLEKVEKLEQLRYLSQGVAIRMVEVAEENIAIDIPADLERAAAYLAQKNSA